MIRSPIINKLLCIVKLIDTCSFITHNDKLVLVCNTQRIFFGTSLNETEIRLYILFSD